MLARLNIGGKRPARRIALAVGIIVVPVVLLSVMAAQHIHSVAAAAEAREARNLRQFAHLTARALSERLEQAEADTLPFLDPTTEDSLMDSLALTESAFPGVSCFAVMQDGRMLYPPPDGATQPQQDRARQVNALRESLFRRLNAEGVGHLYLPPPPAPWIASLHAMRSGATNGVIGIGWDQAHWQEWCGAAAREVLPVGYLLQVRAPDGRVLYASALASAPAPAGGSAVVSLEEVGLAIRVEISPQDPGQLARLMQNQIGLQMAALAALCVMILLGVLLLLSVTLREMELGRLKADFAANVSHELRTPIALIRAAAESLTARTDLDPARQGRYLRMIASETQRLSDLVDTVLRFSRMQRGKQRFTPARASVAEVVQAILERYRGYLEDQGFALHVDLPAQPLYARLDVEGIHLVLANLLDNAVKFSPTRKDITVRVARRADLAVIEVADQGIGIASENQDRIFEGFYRVESHTAKATRGTGIGLALVKEIVNAHNGRVTVASQAGAGATFTVALPAERA